VEMATAAFDAPVSIMSQLKQPRGEGAGSAEHTR
jgi:hypothetical protein